jgi:hypothetical protein
MNKLSAACLLLAALLVYSLTMKMEVVYSSEKWVNIFKEYWESLTGLRQAKGLIQGPSARRTKIC